MWLTLQHKWKQQHNIAFPTFCFWSSWISVQAPAPFPPSFLPLCAPFWCTVTHRHPEGFLIFYKARDSKCTQALKMARKVNKAWDATHDSLPKQVTRHFNDAFECTQAPELRISTPWDASSLFYWGLNLFCICTNGINPHMRIQAPKRLAVIRYTVTLCMSHKSSS